MSGRRGGKTWSASELKKRGWNNDLIRELLPKPRVICYGGRKVRVWDRDEVRRGEEHPRFAHRTAEDAARTRAPTQGMRRTGMLLERAWAAEVGEDSAPWPNGCGIYTSRRNVCMSKEACRTRRRFLWQSSEREIVPSMGGIWRGCSGSVWRSRGFR